MNNEINYVSPFKKFVITVGNLPTAYMESMSYYEAITFLVNYLSNNVIPALNNNGLVVEELQAKFTELKNYVDNYFENLDVQEEINNKLDEMVEDGTLPEIVSEYLNTQINYMSKKIEPIQAGYQIVAHRGSSYDAPENSLPAVKIASEQGFDYTECDIQKTSDGVYVLLHDRSIDRTTNGEGNIDDITYETLQTYNIDTGNGISYYPNLKVPTLDEYLDTCYKYNIKPCIELKGETLTDNDVFPIYTKIVEKGFKDKCLIITSNLSWLIQIRGYNKLIGLQWVYPISTENINTCATHNIEIDTAYEYLTQSLVNYAHNQGVKVNCWVIDKSGNYSALKNYNLDYVTTNSMECLKNINEDLDAINKIIPKSKYEAKQIINNTYLRCTTGANQNYPEFINNNRNSVNLNRGIILQKYSCYGNQSINFSFLPNGIKIALRLFNINDGTLNIDTGWLNNQSTYTPPNNSGCYFLIYFGREDNADVTLNDYNAIINSINNMFGKFYILRSSNSTSYSIQLPDTTKITWGTVSTTANLNAWGSVYSQDIDPDITFPIAYASKPKVMASCNNNGINAWVAQIDCNTTEINKFTIARPTSVTGNVEIDYIAIGR